MLRTFLATVPLLLLLGCGEPVVAPPSVSTTDSAGVTLVRIHRLDEIPLPAWRTEPLFSTADSDSLQVAQFAAALFLPDGTLLAGSGPDLFLFGTSGALLRRVGRAGDGPGEFRSVGRLLLTGDSLIAVSEVWSGRLTLLRSDGSATKVIARLGGAERGREVDPIAVLGDGRLMASYLQARPNRGDIPGVQVGSIERDPMPLLVHDSAGVVHDTLGFWLGLERAYVSMRGDPSRLPIPFARSVVYDGRGETVAIGVTDSIDLSVYTSGLLRLRLMASAAHRPVSRGRFDAWREAMAQWGDGDGGIVLEALRNAPRVSELPAAGAVVVDDQRNLWVGGYVSPGDTVRTWTVLSRSGVPLARVDLPALIDPVFHGPHELLDVQGDRLAVLRLGEDGEPIIEVWELRR